MEKGRVKINEGRMGGEWVDGGKVGGEEMGGWGRDGWVGEGWVEKDDGDS